MLNLDLKSLWGALHTIWMKKMFLFFVFIIMKFDKSATQTFANLDCQHCIWFVTFLILYIIPIPREPQILYAKSRNCPWTIAVLYLSAANILLHNCNWVVLRLSKMFNLSFILNKNWKVQNPVQISCLKFTQMTKDWTRFSGKRPNLTP